MKPPINVKGKKKHQLRFKEQNGPDKRVLSSQVAQNAGAQTQQRQPSYKGKPFM
jgi:hypothetical protein